MSDEEIRISEMRHEEGKMIAGAVFLCGVIIVGFTCVALNKMGYL
tara:strand:+ start:279 stop:413 length:135 start_codon:yes stop_codon:yes gene_type:complete